MTVQMATARSLSCETAEEQEKLAHSHDSHRSIPINDAESPELARALENIDEAKTERLLGRTRAQSSFGGKIHVSPPDEQGATVTSVTLNLIGGGLGTGILSMPWGVAGGSIFLSLGVLAVVLAVNAFTIMILVYAGDKYQQFELGCLLGMLPGKRLPYWSQIVSNVFVLATLWGVMVGYCIVIQEQLVPFMPADNAFLSDKKLWAVVGTALALPLCFLPTRYLSFTSGLSVLVNVYLFGVLIALFSDGLEKEEKHFCYLGFGPGIVTFSSLMQYGVIIQFCVLPMYKEMEDRRPAAFGKALAIAFTFLFVLFSLFAIIGYMCFGPNVNSDVLSNYPSIHDPHKTSLNIPSNIAKVGMVAVVLGVYPLMMLPMKTPVIEYEQQVASDALNGHPDSMLRNIVKAHPTLLSTITVFVIAITSCALSFVVSGLGELNAVSGAAQASFFVGIFPSLIAYHLLEKKESIKWKIGLGFLAVACCGVSCLGFKYVDNHYESLEGDACWWKGSVGSNPN